MKIGRNIGLKVTRAGLSRASFCPPGGQKWQPAPILPRKVEIPEIRPKRLLRHGKTRPVLPEYRDFAKTGGFALHSRGRPG